MRAVMLATALATSMVTVAPVLAQPRQLPVLEVGSLHAGSFDARAFDPLGMPERRALALAEGATAPQAASPPAQDYAASQIDAPMEQDAIPATTSGLSPQSLPRGLFSEGWSRNSFRTQP